MPGAVEELLVFLRANTSDFDRKMAASGKQVESFGASSSGALGKFASIGGVALAAVAAGAVLVGVASFKLADDFEKSHARLEVAVKNAGLSFEREKGKVDAIDKSMQHFGFNASETENALSRLIPATGSLSKANKDLGVAVDIAAARHISLEAATNLLVKAENGNYGALTRLGVASKDQVKQFHSSADAVDFLAGKFKGQGAAAANTFGGKMKELNATIENVGTKIGLKLIPVIENVAQAFAGTAEFFLQNKDAAIALGVAVGGVLVPAMATFIALKVGGFLATLAGNLIQVAQFAYGAATAMYAYASGSEAAAAASAGVAATSPAAALGAAVGPVLAVAAGAAVLTIGLKSLYEATHKQGDALDLLAKDAKALGSESMPKLTKQLGEQNKNLNTAAFATGQYGIAITGQKAAQEEFNKILKNAPELAQRWIDAMERSNLKTGAAKKALAEHIAAVRLDATAQDEYRAKIDGTANSQSKSILATTAAAKAIDAAATASDKAATATDRYRDAIFAAFDANFALIDTTKQLADDTKDSSKSQEDLQKDILAVTKAAGEKAAQDLGPNATASAKSEAAKRGEIDALIGLKTTYPQLAGPIDGYIANLNSIPPVKVTVPIFDKSGAEHDVQVLQSDIDRLHGTTVTIQMAIAGAEGVAAFIRQGGADHNPLTPYAMGGYVPKTGPAFLHKGEVVLNPSQVKAIKGGASIGGGGGTKVEININGNILGGAESGRQLVKTIDQHFGSAAWRSN